MWQGQKANIGSEFPAMPDDPRSLVDFQRRFPGEAAGAKHLQADLDEFVFRFNRPATPPCGRGSESECGQNPSPPRC